MMFQLNEIISFWRPRFHQEATPEKKVTDYKLRITQTREKIECRVNTDALGNLSQFDSPKEMEPYWYLEAVCGEHTLEISMDRFYCTCHSFECSGKGIENKEPCKHLYVLAAWFMGEINA